MAEFLSFSEAEIQYFLLMIQLWRAGTPKLRERFKRQIDVLRDENTRTSQAVATTVDGEVDQKVKDFYYADWTPVAVHALVACDAFGSAGSIAKRLNLAARDVELILERLLEYGLVKKKQGLFRHGGGNMHLPTSSIHNKVNHLNWRLRGLQSSQDSKALHYTSVFSVSEKDWHELKNELVEFIQAQRVKIGSSGSEDAFAFCCDLFRI